MDSIPPQPEFTLHEGESAILKTSLDGTITYVNDAFARLSGFTREELTGRKHVGMLHPGMSAQVLRTRQDALREARPWRGVIRMTGKNAGDCWVDEFVTPTRRHGEIIEYLSVCSEPSRERIQQAEVLYRRMNATGSAPDDGSGWLGKLSIKTRLTAIMALMAVMIAGGGAVGISAVRIGNEALHSAYARHMDPSEMLLRIIALMNDNRTQVMLALQHKPDSPFAAMHDHPLDRHTGQIVRNRDEITRLWNDFHDRAANASPEIRAQAETFYQVRLKYVDEGLAPAVAALTSGDFHLANVTLLYKVNPLYQDAHGKMDDLIGLFKQSAKNEIAAAVWRHDLLMLLVIGGTLSGVLLTLAAGLFLNRAIVRPLRRAISHFEHISQGDLDEDIDISGSDETGQVLSALAEMQAHLKVMLEDIRVREQAESALRLTRDQALETSRLKSEFLSTMSHEIRTPMNGIIGMTDLLLDTPLNEEQRDFANIVRDSAQSLLTIINDILDFSKIEAGKMEVEITDYSPVHLVEGAAELLAAKAREKGLSLMTFIDPKLPPLLRGDPTRLRQVLLNLAGNAVKFTGHGEIHVRALSAGDGWEIRFEVEDTGIGMSLATVGKLFQSFTQADSSTTRKYGGTGLGLAICKRLVELMGGEIGVDSEEGKGSIFWFSLPLVLPSRNIKPHEKPQLGSVKGLRVLVVDDHASDRRILHHYLDSWGMQSTGAAGAADALRLLREALDGGAPYDIAMIDYAMPGANGIDLARAIRSETAFDATRLVLLTAFDQRSLADEARQTGFSAYLTKPVRQSQLFDSIAPKVAGNLLSEPLNEEVFSVTPDTPNFQDALKSGRLVLLAEDNAVNQKVAQLQLNKLGYAVHVVGNGKEAVEAAATLPYAAILMDCQMPVMDGFEATADIRKAEQAGRQRIPIIAMTANAMQGDRERCIAAGMDDYVSKPFDPAKLARTLAAWIAPTGDARPADAVPASAPAATPERVLQVIDFGHLHELFGDDPPLIEELLDVFSASTETLFGKLELACERREPDAVKALAHEAKGSSANMGLRAMADAAARLEESVADQDWLRIAALHTEMKTAWSQALLAIQSYRKDPV